MYRFCECKYSFQTRVRKDEFYTRIHKKDVSFVVL